jgi:uncharacterized protein YbcC (UPF0753/DUF2309 family)
MSALPELDSDARLDVARRATARIAPTWPLDRFIAVNPFWPLVDRPYEDVAAEVLSLSGARMHMPASWYREALDGRAPQVPATLPDDGVRARTRLVDVVDAARDPARQADWSGFVVRTISQHCASVFDGGQAQVRPAGPEGLYARWRKQAEVDLEPVLLMGCPGYREAVRSLPHDAERLVLEALDAVKVPEEQLERYLASLLMDVNGWASWCAYLGFQAGLEGGDDPSLFELLAIRLAWDLLLLRTGGEGLAQRWQHAITGWPTTDAQAWAHVREAHQLQEALDAAWQARLHAQLPQALTASVPVDAPDVQAAFCIDVRSEVFRRALEAQHDGIETVGFAGFFGIPVDYTPVGVSRPRALLPGLLAPAMRVTDTGVSDDLAETRQRRLDRGATWKSFKTGSISSFAFVDAIGLLFAGRLFKDSLDVAQPTADQAGLHIHEHHGRKPRITHLADGTPLTVEGRADLASGVLKGMGLTRRFGRLVALVGHGSQTRNNPHAAGLDCGACCGQSGEVNARAASALLNDPDVRAALAARGQPVPDTTWFVPGLHDTTTDEVHLYDLDEVPPSHAADVERLRAWFAAAGVVCRRERADRLGAAELDDAALAEEVRRRATSWAQVQPEWGLADNAAFIVAPRWRTRALSLDGRSFLHDYKADEDPGFAILEGILTAPMLVTHWINQQYNASTTDPLRYGSGNKVLHNVVGGHLGVFEGNGGDLRIGLPQQCVHDGDRFMHTPQRLSVYVEAPVEAIDDILARHRVVADLVHNGWVHLLQLDSADGVVRKRAEEGWVTVAGG